MEGPWKQHPLHAKSREGVLTPAQCEAIKRDALAAGMSRAVVLTKTGPRPSRKRTCDDVRLPRNPEREWLYRLILDSTERVNARYWRFAITGVEDIRVLRYRPLQRFQWHYDAYAGSLRKLTCIVNLSNPRSYRGGGLQVLGKHHGDAVAPRQGAGTWFPTYLRHRATAPWLGERWVLVAWLTGPPWQ